jgi:hypothetical protein
LDRIERQFGLANLKKQPRDLPGQAPVTPSYLSFAESREPLALDFSMPSSAPENIHIGLPWDACTENSILQLDSSNVASEQAMVAKLDGGSSHEDADVVGLVHQNGI